MNSIHCVPVILSHVVLALSAAAGPPSRLSFNGIDYSATVGEVLLDPGTANRFVMEADGGAPLSVSFIRETPSGQEIREEQRIEGARGRAEFQFGPLAAPPVYEYDSGVVRVRGYGLAIAVRQNGDVVGHWEFRQTLARPDPKPHSYPWWRMGDAPARRLRFLAGGPATTVFDLKSRSLGPLSLRLHDAVLDDQDDLRVEVRLNRGDTPANLAARLVVVAPGGREIWNGKTSLRSSDAWETIPVQARNWPPGEYRIELHPEVEGRVWPDGPSLVYHRRAVRADAVQVSPIAPWTLDRDAARQELVITDFRAAHQRWGAGRMDPVKWKWRGQALVAGGDVQADPVVFRPPLNGSYAVFAQAEGGPGIFVQAGAEGLVRLVRPTWRGKPTFLEAGDLSGR
ncbi:MAG: hypothetical protein NTY38_05465, partial [Acidobacteria bacterium]|nr:hypothetical protein [Acidobacteriota bacterium]